MRHYHHTHFIPRMIAGGWALVIKHLCAGNIGCALGGLMVISVASPEMINVFWSPCRTIHILIIGLSHLVPLYPFLGFPGLTRIERGGHFEPYGVSIHPLAIYMLVCSTYICLWMNEWIWVNYAPACGISVRNGWWQRLSICFVVNIYVWCI